MTTGINTEAHQNQRPQQREDSLLTGYHHYAGEAQLAKGVQRNEAAQILHDLNRPGEGHRPHVGRPEKVTVRGFVDLFQRILQLAIRDFQLSQLKDQRIASLQQGIEQFALGAQLRFQNTTLLAGERLSVSLTDLADLRLLVEEIFIMKTLNTQLRHLRIKLLWFWHLWQTGHLRA